MLATTGATAQITGVQLEKGSTASSFEYRPYTTELQLCQRYYAKTYDIGTAVGTATSTGWIGTNNNSSGVGYVNWRFPVAMRTTPTTIQYQANGATNTWYDSGGGYIMTAATQRSGEQGLVVRVSGGNSAAECAGHVVVSAEL
jgi:hypothetical protein